MTLKIFRRGSARCIGLLSAFITILLCLYYISMGQPSTSPKDYHSLGQTGKFDSSHQSKKHDSFKLALEKRENSNKSHRKPEWKHCSQLHDRTTNITTYNEFSKFDFQPEWIRTKEYWDKTFEDKFERIKSDPRRPPLKVIIVPHSHNDPGWLKTFVNYFQSDSRNIINSIVSKMQEYQDMTFIWSEISFLQMWWDQAHPSKQRAFKKLVHSGRLEITTGGWVMTDEANAHYYAMLDQLIEGHQWLKTNLNITPSVGWSIDPFGHGSTVPFLLSGSNFDGTIIQRIHYSWKQWFAKHQSGDFTWMPFWEENGHRDTERSLLTHNMPYDIYSIKHSCGPHPFICLNFDFRKVPGEYTEYSVKAQFITDDNVQEKAQLLLEQYSRTASLFPHNVALIPLGDDFRYNKETEFDQQYLNYKKLIDYIQKNKETYNVDIGFGTPKQYFEEIKKRIKNFPTLKGDFFVYSDIFSSGQPAYWSGYFTTRPFYKMLSSELEHNLRSCEILFTLAYNAAREYKHENAIKIFEKNYEKMILARRNLGLFQHHDAITGTSKAAVMRDYGLRLFQSIQDVVKLQESAIELLIQNGTENHNFLLNELERSQFNKVPEKTPVIIGEDGEGTFTVFNSLAQSRTEVITIRSSSADVKVLNEEGKSMKIQINPIWIISDYGYDVRVGRRTDRLQVSSNEFEIMFVATLPPLSLITYKIVPDSENFKRQMATIYCEDCVEKINGSMQVGFDLKSKPSGDIQLENNLMRLLFDEKTGFLKTVTRKNEGKPRQCAIKFAGYKSAQFHSGAYLFKTDPEQHEAEKDVFEQYDMIWIFITSGLIASDVTVVYGQFLSHTVRIFNTNTHLDKAIYIENDVDFEPPPKNRETELFMRFVTDIENGGELPEFYTDQNGFQFLKRTKVPSIGIEGNYFPITSAAFIQDSSVRMTLLTTHAQGAASLEPGYLEVMLDRRTLYDDYRGMGEGVVDSRLTRQKFWLLIEDMPENTPVEGQYQVPSLFSNHFSNNLRFPPNIYFTEVFDLKKPSALKSKITLLEQQFPCDLHLLNLRTLTDPQLPLFPSQSALIVLHRQGYDCSMSNSNICTEKDIGGLSNTFLNKIKIKSIVETSLTGLENKNSQKPIKQFSSIHLDPMDIKTFNISFRL